jgi:hypothetical protein
MIRNCVHCVLLAILFVSVVNGVAMAGPGIPSAPEIDPGSMASALALASGGVAILADKFRRKR